MALVLKDRVVETTNVSGTGTVTFLGPQDGFQAFSSVGNGNTTYYTIEDPVSFDWEVGIGTYNSNTLTRDTVFSSSNGGALVYFGSGTKNIFLDLPSEVVNLNPGDVFGPASAINNNFASFNLTTGKLIKDSGFSSVSFATAAQGAKADTAVQPGDLGTAAYLDAGSALGVATLDAGGKVPVSQIPALGDLNYQGTWNATTNSPTLTSSAGTKGFYYVVNVAGTTNLNGITDWQIGDWAVFNGSVWQKIDNTDAVTSVNGYTGTVVLTYTDVGAQVAGTYVNSVSGTAPVVSSGGTTPAISMAKATGSVDGYLSSTDWTTFNSKGTGNVVGPSSATDNAITRYDTTTGKLIQNSTVTIDDNGNIDQANAITFDITPATLPTTPGTLYWDNADGNQTLSLVMEGNHATQQIGEEMYYRIKASSAITEGQVVMFTGTVGASGGLTGAPATGLTASTASYVMGVATQDIPLNDWGYITQFGLVRQINTTGGAESWVDGQILYLNPSVAGGLTKTLPTAPNPKVQVCAVVYAASNGSLFIRPTFGGELGQFEGDVGFTSVAAGNLIRRNAGNTAWENVTTIPNTNLANSAVTVGTTAISLGASSTTLAGLTSVSSTSFTGALTGNASTATTLETARNIAGVSFNGSADIAIPLDNLSDVIIATPVVDQILKYNGAEWVNGAASSISAGFGVEYYNATPQITASGTNNALAIFTLSATPITTAEQTATITTINGTVAGTAWLSTALGRTTIDAGTWDFTVFASVSSIGGVNTTVSRQMYAALPFVTGTVTTTGTGTSRTATASAGTPFAVTEIVASATNTLASYLQTPQGLYQITARTSDTVVTISTLTTYVNEAAVAGTVWKLLFAGGASPNLTTSITQYDIISVQPAFTISLLTKLGAITFATSTGVRTVTTTYNGALRNTHIASPLAVLHNQLGGLQGGVANEQYHLTDAEHTGTGTGVFVRATSPTLVTPVLGTPTSGTLTNCTGLPNGGLVNSSISINGTSIALGGSSTTVTAVWGA